jgi:hypothetical protein
MIVGTKSIKISMIQKLVDKVWEAIEKLYAIPEDLFDFQDDENAIIEE